MGPRNFGRRCRELARIAPRLSRAELGDLAARLARDLGDREFRAAIVASRPSVLAQRLETLGNWLAAGEHEGIDVRQGIFLGRRARAARVGYLFTGQGVPVSTDGGALGRRFPAVRELFDDLRSSSSGDPRLTEFAQPAIVRASLAGLRILDLLELGAEIAIGHSLGELTAVHWAGAFGEDALLRLATGRGRAMSRSGPHPGAMASIAATADEVVELLDEASVVIAGINSPRQTIISGDSTAVDDAMDRARRRGWQTTRLPISHAFHSPHMARAVPEFTELMASEEIGQPFRSIISTVTGERLAPDVDLREVFARQLTAPVRFMEAMARGSDHVDLWIEVGPGRVLTALAGELAEVPAVALDVGGDSLVGLLSAVGAAFAMGAPVAHEALFAGRFTRDFDLHRQPLVLRQSVRAGASDRPGDGLDDGSRRTENHPPRRTRPAPP